MGVITNTENVQEKIEKKLLSLKKAYNDWSKRMVFSYREQCLFFCVFFVCFVIGTVMLFHIYVYELYVSDFWLVPFGVGCVALLFFLWGKTK